MPSTALLPTRSDLDQPGCDASTGSASPPARARRRHRPRVAKAADWHERMAAVDAELDRSAAGSTSRVAGGLALLAFADLLVLSLLMLVVVYLTSG